MTKRLFSLAMISLLAVTVWADDVTGNKAITFSSAANTGGIYLHGSTFSVDDAHVANGNKNGTFSGTSTNWEVTKVLTSSLGANLSSLGNINAESGGPAGSLAFTHSGAGTLYVVYGATSATDGKFCIATKPSSASSYTVTEKTMKGINYSGPLGTRADSYTYTLEQTSIELSAAGTVYLAGTQSYCIYAILFVPSGSQATEKSTPVVYDFTKGGFAQLETQKGNIHYYTDKDNSTGTRYIGENGVKTRLSLLNTKGVYDNGLSMSDGNRPLLVDGLAVGDLIRIVYSASDSKNIVDGNVPTTGSTISPNEIASGKVLTVTSLKKIDTKDPGDYIAFILPTKNITISQIAINKGIKPRVSFKSQNGTSLVYTAKFYEGETLYYKGPGITGTQSVEYPSANNGEVDITATGKGNLECWTMFGGEEAANKSEVDSRVVALPQQPGVTLKTTNGTTSTYTVTFQEGETLHYTAPGVTDEQTVEFSTTNNGQVDIEVSANGNLVCWTTIGELLSSTNTTTVSGITINDDVDTGKEDETYDFQTWVKGVGATGDPTRLSSDITISGNNKVKLVYYFAANGKEDQLMDVHSRFAVDAYSEVGYDKNDDSKSALRNKANGAAFRAPNISIRNLKEKDHVTITSGVSVEGKAAVRFLSTNAHLKGIGTTPSADGTTIWENGKTWVMDADGNLDLKLGDTDYQAYIYKITITNRENVSAATFATATDNENHLVIIGGTTDEGTAKTYYTLDGTEPTTSSTEINGASVILTDLAASCTVKTLTVGSTGKTAYGRYNFIYVNTIPSASVAIDFEKAKANNEELIFADDAITVGWSTGTDSGSKKEFYKLNNNTANLPIDGKISWRVPSGKSKPQLEENGIKSNEYAFAIHDLTKNDEIIIIHNGTLKSYVATDGDGISVDGSNVPAGSEIATGKTIKVTSIGVNNSIVLFPTKNTVISAIYINKTPPVKPEQPKVSYKQNKDGKAVYTIASVDDNAIKYQLDNTEVVSPTEKSVDVEVSKKTTLNAWAYNSELESNILTVDLMKTPIVETNGNFDFTKTGLSENVSLVVDESNVAMTVGNVSLYKPSLEQAATFAGKFLFQKPGTTNTAIRSNQLHINANETNKEFYMALLNVEAGKCLTIADGNKQVSKVYIGEKQLTYGEPFEIESSDITEGHLILKFDVSAGSASVQKLEFSDPVAPAVPIYGKYNLRTIASEKVGGDSGEAEITLIDRTETANGDNTDISGKLTDNGAISIVYRKTDDGSKDFKWSKASDAETGLRMSRGGASEASFYINSLKAGDWFKIETGDNHLLFNNADFYDLNAGSSTSVSKGGVVESGHTYVAKKDVSALQLYYDTKQQGYLYIYSVEISNGDAVPAPMIGDYDFSSGKVTITVENSYKGNTPTIYYGIGDAEPTTAYTGPISISEACTIKALAKVGDLQSTLAVKDVVLEAVTIPEISVSGKQVTITGGTSNDPSSSVTTYYTLNGAEPTTSSTKYASAITLDQTRIVKVMSVSSSGIKSDVITQKVVIDGQTPSTVLDFTSDEALKPLEWGQDHVTGYYNNGSDKSDGNFKYITNEPVHAKMMWQSDKNDTENANNNAGNGIEGIASGRAFAITDLAVGDVIYITYTTTGDNLTASKHSSKGNTIKVGENTAEGDNALLPIASGVKIEVTSVDEENNFVAFMPNSKMNIQRIEINPMYQITATATNGSISVNSPAGTDLSTATFAPGSTVTLTATGASSEWVFSHWVVNGIQTTEATLTLTMDSNKSVEAVFRQRVSANGVPVILVAGQSNTDGRIAVSETAFPYDLNHTQISYCNGVDQTNEGVFAPYGTTPKSDSGERWGYDAIIYNKVQELLTGQDFYVIKQSKGNTAINTMCSGNKEHWWSANPVWLSRNTSANQGGRSLLKGFLDNIDKSLKALEDANKEYDIKFLMWHQGEADRGKQNEYEMQMKAVVNELRNYLVKRTNNNKYSNLPIILGGIADVSKEYSAGVEAGKQSLAEADANIYYAPTGSLTLETDFRSDQVHFNVTGAGKIANSVWDIITSNNLMTGITLAGSDMPAENPLTEDVVNKTTLWTFNEAKALTSNASINGLYPHGKINVKAKDYGETTLTDGTPINAAFAAETPTAQRTISEGLTAGNDAVTCTYGVNVSGEGTFMALIKPMAVPENETHAKIWLNGEVLQSIPFTTTDYIQLATKSSGVGTFYITCDIKYELIAAKFIAGSSNLEIMTPPTIQAGEKVNTIKIIPGTSDLADAVVKTYYTIDDSTPTAESTPYTGADIELTEDCVVRAVSISSKGGKAYSEPYTFEKGIPGQVINASKNFQTCYADDALDFTGITAIEAFIVMAPSDIINTEAKPVNANNALSRGSGDSGIPSGLQLVRVYKVPKGTAFLVKFLDTTNENVTVPYMVTAINGISTATETIAVSENLLKHATQAVGIASGKKLFEASSTADSFVFNGTNSVGAGKYYLDVPTTAVGEMTVSIKIQEENDMPYLVEIDTFEVSESVVYDFANTTDNINVDDKTKTRSLIYKGADKAAGFRYVLNGSEPLRVLTYSNTGGFTQGSGVTVKSSRQFAIEGLKTGDMIRIIHNGTVTDANNASSGTTITDLKGNAITGGIASGQAVKVATADATNNYAVFMANEGDLTIALIAINQAIAPNVEKDVEQSSSTAYKYKVSFYEGETLHYTSPDISGEQTISHTGNPATITVTKNGELKVWTTYGETASEKVTKAIDFSTETAIVNVVPGYQTYYTDTALDFTDISKDELRAFIVRTKEATSTRNMTRGASTAQLELLEVMKVPAGTALILWSKKASSVEIPKANESATAKIVVVTGAEVASEVNLLKKASKTKKADTDETIFVPNTDGGFSFEYSAFVTRGDIYLELSDLNLDDNASEIVLGEVSADGTVVPLVIEETDVDNATVALDTENTTATKKVYVFKFPASQKLYYKRPGQDDTFRSQSYKDETFSVNVTNNGYLEFYTEDISSKETSKKNAVEISTLAPKATLTKIGDSSSTYEITFFDGATLYYTLGNGAEQSVSTGSPAEITVTAGGKLAAYSKTSSETSDTLSANVYAPTPSIADNGKYDFSTLNKKIGTDYVLTTTGYDGTVDVGDLTLNTPNGLTKKTLDIFAFLAARADGKGESTDWRLLNAGRLRATKSANTKYLAILNVEKDKYVTLTYSGTAVKYETTGSAKLEEGTTTLTSKQSYQITNGGTLLLSIAADESNNCDITVIGISDSPNSSSTDSSDSKSDDNKDNSKKSSSPVSIDFYQLENDTTSIYRFTWEKGSLLHYILESEGTEQTGGTSGTYDLTISKSDKVEAWITMGSDTSKVVSATLFAPTPAPTISGNIDFFETIEDLPADMPVTLDMNRMVTIRGQKLYMPNALTYQTFKDRFAFSELEKSSTLRIRKNRTMMFAKGKDVMMGILNLKQGEVVAFDYTGNIQIMNGEVLRMESVSARTRASVSGTLMKSGAAYIVKEDCDLLLNVVLADSAVTVNKMYVGSVPHSSTPAAIDFVTAGEEFESLTLEGSTGVYYYNKEKAQNFVWITNNTEELPINNKISTENGNGTITTQGLTAGGRRIAIHHLAKGDKIKLRFSGGSVTFEGHNMNSNIISVEGRRLTPQDTLQSGDIITVDQVNYLYNYVVLKLDSKASINGIYINEEETEKVSMPTIVDKGNNTVLITAGVSSIGNQVTTCYTTDGSEPTRMNGTSGPYDEFDVELLGGGLITIKAVSYTDDGLYSRVAELTIFADERVKETRSAGTRKVTGTYDMQGNKINIIQPGKFYIRDGKKVYFGRNSN